MFKTIRARLVAIIALILLLTAVIVIYFTHRDVGREMTRVEQNNAENILNSVYLNIQGVYRGLIFDRVNRIDEAKKRLHRETRIILTGLELSADTAGEIHNEDQRSRREKSIEWLQALQSGSTDFFAADAQNNIFFASENELVGQNLETMRDIRGEPLSDAVNLEDRGYEQYIVFSPGTREVPGGQNLAYLSYFPGFEWILGAFVDISSIEEAEQDRMDQLIKELESQFRQARLAESGSLFIFDQDSELVIEPEDFAGSPEFGTLLQEVARQSRDQELARSRMYVGEEAMLVLTRYFRPLDWYLSAMIPEAEIQAPARGVVQRQSWIIMGIFLLGATAAIYFVRHISRPLALLAGHTRDLAGRDLTSDDFDAQQIVALTRKHHDEVGELAGSFLYMQEELKNNVRKLLETTAAKERYESELSLARDIQMSIVPRKFPAFPDIREFDLFAILEPAREVGGDLYDFFLLDEQHLCFTVGDVSDKGMPAALYMAITRTLIQSHAAKEKSPAGIMTRVNNDLSRDNPKSMFVTLIIGILNMSTGEIRYANAGHNLPILMDAQGGLSFVKGISGPVAGAMEDLPYRELLVTLNPGESLFLYTDGVTEAMNQKQELFSDERLLQTAMQAKNQELQKLLHDIREEIKTFSANFPQSDDITMFILKYHGAGDY
ncbi:SpoIIE family protein phosphatase [Desulfonatronospira sp.]|uniref:SpoIIE family protein phosphatase n=1 Tax=Desulfonatronospira sp. TaxID=1962951 RepID=UPI0025BCCFCB|nr:SpoIIE family protein phosphatase [Desulfonatronospira sp.]